MGEHSLAMMPFRTRRIPVGPVGFTHLSYAPSPPLPRTSRKHGRHRRRLRAFQPERRLGYSGYLGYLSTYLHVLRRLRVDLDVEAVLDRLDHRQKDRHVALRTHTVAARRVASCNAARVSASAQACVSWRSQRARARACAGNLPDERPQPCVLDAAWRVLAHLPPAALLDVHAQVLQRWIAN